MKKKICFLISSLSGGGAEKGLVNLMNQLDPEKYELHLCVDVPLFDRAKELHVPVQLHLLLGKGRLAMGKKSLWAAQNVGYQAQRTLNGSLLRHLMGVPVCDVYFLFMDSPNVALLMTEPDGPVTILRMSIDYEKFFESFIGSKDDRMRRRHIALSARCNHIVAPAVYSAQTYANTTGISQSVQTIYNINDPAELERQAQLPEPGLQKNGFTLLTVGRLDEQKGFLRLLDVVARLRSESLPFELWILGKGPQQTQLEAKIEALGLDNVRLLGYRDNPYPYIKAADLYVSASYFEGLSNAAKEALLLGVPCVVANCSGMEELFGANSEYGLITENTDEALYEGLRRMLTDQALYAYYREKVQERQPYFSVESSLKAYEALFERNKTL